MRFSGNPLAIPEMLRFADSAADNCYTDCIARNKPRLCRAMKSSTNICRIRLFGLALMVLSCVGCRSGMQYSDPSVPSQFKYAQQSAAMMEMREREERGVTGSIPSMGNFPMVPAQGVAASDQ